MTVGQLDDHEAIFHFETAWSPPCPCSTKLAKKFPKACFRLIWCDEGDDTQNRVYWAKGKRENE